MRRGKRFLENENLIIYIGTAVFFVLAICVGIVMYMTAKTNIEIGKNTENIENDSIKQQEAEDASNNFGKTVEEQEKNQSTDKATSDEVTSSTQNTKNDTQSTKTNTSETSSTNKTESTKKDEGKNVTQETKPAQETKKDEKTTEVKNPISFAKPTEGEVITQFAQESLVYSETLKEWITHTGIDIKADKTSVIKAAADGVVSSIVNDPRYGLTVVISHDEGYQTVYSNLLTAEFVVEGEEVKQGQTIGTAGNTAAFESNMECHLHFEIMQDGKYLDPNIYLK